MSLWGEEAGRWRFRCRRFLFCFLVLAAAPSSHTVYPQTDAQPGPVSRLVQREIQVTRELSGVLRVVESVQLNLVERGADTVSDLRIIRLQEAAQNVQAISRQASSAELRYDAPWVIIAGQVPTMSQIVVVYTLTAEPPVIEFRAGLFTEELVLHVARGSIEARPDPALSDGGSSGSASRPRRRYEAQDLVADSVVRLAIISKRSDWRQRLAVLLATALAAGLAIVWVWRGGGSGASRPERQTLS